MHFFFFSCGIQQYFQLTTQYTTSPYTAKKQNTVRGDLILLLVLLTPSVQQNTHMCIESYVSSSLSPLYLNTALQVSTSAYKKIGIPLNSSNSKIAKTFHSVTTHTRVWQTVVFLNKELKKVFEKMLVNEPDEIKINQF